jgi:hypothetical protein
MQDAIHELWLIYNELKEMDTGDSVHLAQRLGKVINELNKPAAAILGAAGGAAKTDAKREAARANGAKGGRPRTAKVTYSTSGDEPTATMTCPTCGHANNIPAELVADFDAKPHTMQCACGLKIQFKKQQGYLSTESS